MKKLLLIIAALILAFNMTACKDKNEAEEADATAIATEESIDDAKDSENSEDKQDNEKGKDEKGKDEKDKNKKDEDASKSSEKTDSSKDKASEDNTTDKDSTKAKTEEEIHVPSDKVVSSEEAVDKIDSSIETEVIYTEPKDESDTRPTVYWATSEDKVSGDVAYHKKDCSVIANKKPEELPWEIIDALGMLPCEKCNP